MKILQSSKQQDLYELLRALRNSIFDPSCYYKNNVLELFAANKPLTKDQLLKCDCSIEKYDRFGESFLSIIRQSVDSKDAVREEISDNELKTLLKIREYEITLYDFVHSVLQKEFGDKWWYDGISDSARTKASELHEVSKGTIPREFGLTFIQLKDSKFRLGFCM